jgi:hypothetical protein
MSYGWNTYTTITQEDINVVSYDRNAYTTSDRKTMR